MTRAYQRRASLLVILLSLGLFSIRANSQPQTSQASLKDLVRGAVSNDESSATSQNRLFTYKEKTDKPKGSVVKQIVETPEGILGRVLLINDRPLSPTQRNQEDARVNRLLDPHQMQTKRKEQKEDEDRTLKMLRAIPDAFLFEYMGEEMGANGHHLVKLKFSPDPKFNPPTRESLVFEGMSGEMTIDKTAMHIAHIDGTLFRDVTIGWGIIGRLNKGGRFVVSQAEVYPRHWDTTSMTLDFTGKALIFKNIQIKENESAWDFRPVEKMTVQEALSFLRAQEGQPVTVSAHGGR